MINVGDKFEYTSSIFGAKFIIQVMGSENGKYGIYIYNERGSLIDDSLRIVEEDFFVGEDIKKIGE